MARFVINNSDELIKFIDDKSSKTHHQMNLQLIDSHNANTTSKSITTLPQILIDIINSYLPTQIHVSKYCISDYEYTFDNALCRRYHEHYKFVITNNFSNINFALTYCFHFWCDHKLEAKNIFIKEPVYDTLSCCDIDDNADIFEREISGYPMVYLDDYMLMFENRHPKCARNYLDDASRLLFLNNALANPNEYFGKADKFVNNFCNVNDNNCSNVLNDNVFFNCYSGDTNQYNSLNTNVIRYSNHVEKCERCKDSTDYNYVFVKKYGPTLIKYKVINHEKLMYIIAVNKLLYDIVNERIIIKQNKYSVTSHSS